MLIKAGVSISRLNRYPRKFLNIVDAIFKSYNQELVITSTDDGNHSAGSLHYGNDAFDIRLPERHEHDIVAKIREAAGSSFDIVRESTHIHIEFDPKGV